MKIDTAEKYKALQDRRKRRKAQHSVQLATEQPRRLTDGMKPNHHLRAQSIGMITEAMVRPHKKDKETTEDEG